jgi:hypothetical protein
MSLNFIHGYYLDTHIKPHTDAILELHNKVFPDHTYTSMEQCNGKFKNPYWLLVLWGTRLIGICAIGLEEGEKGYLYNVAVTKYQRRKKVASALNYNLRKIFPGYKLTGHVQHDNIPAMMTFGKLGGVPQEKEDRPGYTTYQVQF